MTTIQVRVDKKIKSAANKQFEKMGLDMSTGVKMFLSQVVRTKSIPFPIFSADNLPETEKKALLREARHALKYGKRYSSAEEMHRDILQSK